MLLLLLHSNYSIQLFVITPLSRCQECRTKVSVRTWKVVFWKEVRTQSRLKEVKCSAFSVKRMNSDLTII
jgi:hypothetical protein